MTIEARIHGNIIREARKGVTERKDAEGARVGVSQIFKDLRRVFDNFSAINNSLPTERLAGRGSAMDLHVKDVEIDGEVHVRLVDSFSGMYVNVDGIPVSIRVTEKIIELSIHREVPRARSYSGEMHTTMGWPTPEDPPFEVREPSSEEVGFIEEFVEALKDPNRTKICPEMEREHTSPIA